MNAHPGERATRPRASVALGIVASAAFAGGITALVAALPAPAGRARIVEAVGSRHAVATENAIASRAASTVLAEGGDAVDAAVAATLVLGVATPTACGIGGGGFAIVHRAKEGRTVALDFRETAPALVDVEALSQRPLPASKRGALVGVPGEIAGLAHLHALFGKRAWAADVEPAIHAAERGVPLSAHVRRVAALHSRNLVELAPSLAVRLLAPGGPLPVGARVVRRDLAGTLRAIAARGAPALYEGEIAEAIVAAARMHGGRLTIDDLARYRPIERTPIRVAIGRREIVTMPPPSAGGLMVAELARADALLRTHTGRGLDAYPARSAAHLHVLAELMRGALDDRARFVGDPDFAPIDTKALLADGRLSRRIGKLDPWVAHEPVELRVDEHGTSHLSIVDAEGNAVALTTTVNGPFGARIVAGETGIVLNDQLDDFAKGGVPGDTLPPNIPRPFARPTSSMAPTVVLEDGAVVLVAGGSGGLRIATSVTMATLGWLVFGASAGELVGWPRMHPQGRELLVEPTMPTSVREELARRGEHVVVAEAMNALQIVTVERRGGFLRIVAAADPRKGGVALCE